MTKRKRPVIAKHATTPSEENYVECLYRRLGAGPVRPSEVAEALAVSRPSVTRAMGVLAEKGLVRRAKGGGLELTKAGEALGAAITRRDACLTALLVDVLGMDPEAADPQVHQLEHLVSDEVLARLEVLVDQARRSKAFMNRLRARLAADVDTIPRLGFNAGQSPVHAGARHEKRAPARDAG